MKLITLAAATILTGLCVAQDPDLRNRLLNTDFTKLDQPQCQAAADDVKKTLPVSPYPGYVWEEGKEGTFQAWYNGGVSDGKFSSNTTNRTFYCGRAGFLIGQSDYKTIDPAIYCDGTEGSNGIQVQPIPRWSGSDCHVDEGISNYNMKAIKRMCGCKNQPPKHT